jgi:hypothetical protein
VSASLRTWPPPWCCSGCCSTSASMAAHRRLVHGGYHLPVDPHRDRRFRMPEDISHHRDVDAARVAAVYRRSSTRSGQLGRPGHHRGFRGLWHHLAARRGPLYWRVTGVDARETHTAIRAATYSSAPTEILVSRPILKATSSPPAISRSTWRRLQPSASA